MMISVNAVIKHVHIGINREARFIISIYFDLGNSALEFGPYCLYSPVTGLNDKNYAGHFMFRLLKTVGVRTWDSLEGSAVRVCVKDGAVQSLGHIINDSWFDLLDEFPGTAGEVTAA